MDISNFLNKPILTIFLITNIFGLSVQAKNKAEELINKTPTQIMEEAFAKVQAEEEFRKKVEEISYNYTSSLCYIYEFRFQNHLNVRFPNPISEIAYILSEKQNVKLAMSMGDWFLSLVNPSIAMFSRNEWVEYKFNSVLFETDGFKKAAQACSVRIKRTDMDYIIKRDLQFNEYAGKIISFLGLRYVIKKVLVSFGSYIGKDLLKYHNYLDWAVFTGTTSFALVQLVQTKPVVDAIQIAIDDPSVVHPDPWSMRRQEILEHAENYKNTKDKQAWLTLNREKYKSQEAILIIKRDELSDMILSESNHNFKKLAEKVQAINLKADKGLKLSPEEIEFSIQLRFFLALDLVLNNL